MMWSHQAKAMIEAGNVVRYHTDPGPMQQNIAHHSWGVAALIAAFHPNPRPELLTYALMHDVPERVVGDVPHPSKKRSPELRELLHKVEAEVAKEMGIPLPELEEDEVKWVRYCDMLEAGLYAAHLYLEYGFPRFRRVAQEAYICLMSYEWPDELPTGLSLLTVELNFDRTENQEDER